MPSPWCTSRSIDQRLGDQAVGQQGAGGDRHVVEDAKAGAERGVRVVAAAGRVAGEAMLQGQAGGQHRATDGAAAAQRQRWRHRQAEAALGFRVEPLLQDGGDIARRVREFQPPPRCRLGPVHLVRQDQAGLAEIGEQAAKLGHREAVGAGQGGHVGRVVDDRYAHAAELEHFHAERGSAASSRPKAGRHKESLHEAQ